MTENPADWPDAADDERVEEAVAAGKHPRFSEFLDRALSEPAVREAYDRAQRRSAARRRLRSLWPVYRYGYMPTRGSWLDDGEGHAGRWWFQIGPYRIGWGWDG